MQVIMNLVGWALDALIVAGVLAALVEIGRAHV